MFKFLSFFKRGCSEESGSMHYPTRWNILILAGLLVGVAFFAMWDDHPEIAGGAIAFVGFAIKELAGR